MLFITIVIWKHFRGSGERGYDEGDFSPLILLLIYCDKKSEGGREEMRRQQKFGNKSSLLKN
jgi:hypothetical protein